MKQFCGLCAKRECDSCAVPMVQHIFIFSHICCAIYMYTHRMSIPSHILLTIYISLYGHLHRAPLFLVTLYLGCSLLWHWLGWGVARQWTPETALSRCCWLSQAAFSPTRRNTTLSFLKCVTASGVLKTAGNSSHTCARAHIHTHAHTQTLQTLLWNTTGATFQHCGN